MTDNRRTKGPWKMVSGAVVTENGIPIAHMDREPGNGTYGAERDDNCRMIAAAPELLEACKNVVWKLSHGGDKGDGFAMNTIDLKDAVVRLCQTAIAKAEGK